MVRFPEENIRKTRIIFASGASSVVAFEISSRSFIWEFLLDFLGLRLFSGYIQELFLNIPPEILSGNSTENVL